MIELTSILGKKCLANEQYIVGVTPTTTLTQIRFAHSSYIMEVKESPEQVYELIQKYKNVICG